MWLRKKIKNIAMQIIIIIINIIILIKHKIKMNQ